MRELILLRHAQAEPATGSSGDFERPLSAHGQVQAHAAARWLVDQDCRPGLILHSPAARTRATAEAVHAATPGAELRAVDGIHDATPGELIAIVDEHGADAIPTVMLVGHNPGMERLLGLLTQGRSGSYRGMMPAALARIGIAERIEPGAGRLLAFWSP